MKHYILLTCLALPIAASADPFAVHQTARDMFASLPRLVASDDMMDECGAGANSNQDIAYCSTQNVIFYDPDWASTPSAAYDMAHVLGHAIQIKHGIADLALRTISARREDEAALRGMVTRQVECLAGVLVADAGLAPMALSDVHDDEPFTDAHWGRDPLNGGPRVSIGFAARAEWFETGQAARDVGACTVGEIPSDILVDALR